MRFAMRNGWSFIDRPRWQIFAFSLYQARQRRHIGLERCGACLCRSFEIGELPCIVSRVGRGEMKAA
jgi:hypothetical protein